MASLYKNSSPLNCLEKVLHKKTPAMFSSALLGQKSWSENKMENKLIPWRRRHFPRRFVCSWGQKSIKHRIWEKDSLCTNVSYIVVYSAGVPKKYLNSRYKDKNSGRNKKHCKSYFYNMRMVSSNLNSNLLWFHSVRPNEDPNGLTRASLL